MQIALPFCHPEKVALLRWAQGVCLCHAAARKKPCIDAAAPTWWHSCRSPGSTAQGAPACWEGERTGSCLCPGVGY